MALELQTAYAWVSLFWLLGRRVVVYAGPRSSTRPDLSTKLQSGAWRSRLLCSCTETKAEGVADVTDLT